MEGMGIEPHHEVKQTVTDFFDDKFDAFIEGYRFVPSGMVWVRSDGERFVGEMISPWIDFELLDVYQPQFIHLSVHS